MISANELRIGNKVIRDGIHVTVDGMSIWDASHNTVQYDQIPLTPEILERAGFKKSFDQALPYQVGYEKSGLIFDAEYQLSPVSQEGDENGIGNPLKYVHQLQNLYFALTGEELEIKYQ